MHIKNTMKAKRPNAVISTSINRYNGHYVIPNVCQYCPLITLNNMAQLLQSQVAIPKELKQQFHLIFY